MILVYNDDDLLKVGGSRVLVEPNSLWSNLPKVSLLLMMMMMMITNMLIMLVYPNMSY